MNRVALVHYWLLGMRGGERVLEAMCELFPDAEIFTLFYDPERVSPLLRSRKIHVSPLNPARRFYQSLLPVMPLALESFDLRGFDLVISSESGPAKGVIVPSGTRHICYCHTPMRYLWDLYPFYRQDVIRSPLQRMLMAPIANYLRLWDYASASRVDRFVANSENVRRRVRRAYGMDADVVHPPVPVNNFRWRTADDYYLVVSEMTPYKRLDYAVRGFSRSGRRLKIAGEGPEYKKLRALAGQNVEFCGRVSDQDLQELYARSRALIMPGEEDFGMTMVESLASGKPVIALGRGGAAEIVKEDCGILYQQPGEEFLERALQQFESADRRFDPLRLRGEAGRYSPDVFARGLLSAIESPPADLDRRSVDSGIDDHREDGERREGYHKRPNLRRR